jgi:hypothetical protein
VVVSAVALPDVSGAVGSVTATFATFLPTPSAATWT